MLERKLDSSFIFRICDFGPNLQIPHYFIINTSFNFRRILFQLVSSLQGAIEHSDTQHPVFYIGALTLTLDNVHGVDASLKEALRVLGSDDEDVYQSFRSCYFYKQRSVLKIGTFVCLTDGAVGKIEEFMFTRVAKFIRLQTYNFNGMAIKDFKVLQPSGRRKVVQISVVQRKVIVYNGNHNLLYVDFDRPSFSFDFNAVPDEPVE